MEICACWELIHLFQMSNLPPAPGHDRLTGEPARPDDIASRPERPGPRTTARNASRADDDKRKRVALIYLSANIQMLTRRKEIK